MVIVYNIHPEKQKEIMERMITLGIFEHDLDEHFIRGSGKGGQKKNKTSNCVQLTHIPTGMMVRFEKYRERSLNQILARRLLCEKVEQQMRGTSSALQQEQTKKKKQKKRNERRRKKKHLELF